MAYNMVMVEIRQTEVYARWFKRLRDRQARVRIDSRIRRLSLGNPAVWGKSSKGQEAADPVRVEGAWPALVSRELFDDVQQAMSARAPKVQRPGRVGSKFLLSGLLRCGACGRPYSAQGAKSGQFAYYICGTLFREGAGTCSARYLNAPRLETFVVENMDERQSTRKTTVLVGGGPRAG